MLSEDVYENVLYYDVAGTPASFEGVADAIVAAFTAWGLHAGINGAEVRVYELGGGQPVFQKSYAYSFTGGTGPQEVALCLSYASVDDWSVSTARRRGRIYLGPFGFTTVNQTRPTTATMSKCLDLGEALAAAGSTTGSVWQVFSQVDGVGRKIESISVDDAWDTQRRRGLSPTNRTVRNVP